MTTDTLSPIKTKRVEYSLTEVYNAVEARLNKLDADVAGLTVQPSQNYVAAMMVSQQKSVRNILNILTEWKKAGVETLVTDSPICGESALGYKPGYSLADQIKDKRLKPS